MKQISKHSRRDLAKKKAAKIPGAIVRRETRIPSGRFFMPVCETVWVIYAPETTETGKVSS